MLEGTYITKRDGGVEYTYEASCGMYGANWHWRATVRRQGMLAGKPTGVIYDAPSFVEDPVLRQVVEEAIEKRIGVD